MELPELLLLALSLAMDAFAVSVCKGLSLNKIKLRHAFTVGAWFGIFQGAMPLIGYFGGNTFEAYITAFDHWISFLLLAFIGIRMVIEAVSGGDDCTDSSLDFKSMLFLAVATSIDALAVGVAFSLMDEQVNIWLSVAVIAVITFMLSAVGVKAGSFLGSGFKNKAEMAGGLILLLLGLKILLEDLGLISF